MRKLPLNHSIRQMFLTLGGFLVAMLLLESSGLRNWADHLEPGPLRTIAQPSAFALHSVIKPLGVGGFRERALDQAAHLGWTDDAVQLARATAARPGGSQPQTSSAKPGVEAQPNSILAAAAVAPIVSSVPRSVHLDPLTPVEQGRARVVVLAGDSMMAVGFGANLMRRAAEDKNLRVLRAFKSGTGLARPDVFNWMDEYPAMLGSERPDVVIVAMGANDGQSFIVDGKVQLFGSAEWRKTYQSRVAAYLSMVESTGARVLWAGLPPMRSETFNQRISMINRIAYTVVSQDPHASWLSTALFVSGESGEFQEFADLPNGRTVRLRAPDGIHFAEEGASSMTAVLMKWLDPPLASAFAAPKPLPPRPPARADFRDSSSPTATIASAHPVPAGR